MPLNREATYPKMAPLSPEQASGLIRIDHGRQVILEIENVATSRGLFGGEGPGVRGNPHDEPTMQSRATEFARDQRGRSNEFEVDFC
ncbi:hypothetical protein TBK1r_66910 [Stieleria magnilauensis]|uniref:Uncharacterized protein n=1 Tax=Stieleria magnilauensis TaxID=2527963 RepID=A0ABX5Y053_9BACT|nr:hypothetical protein TBK1r_66910 [Planctomycetes bacterium TBK1r]